ncbi:MAG: hypothetical protein QM709_06545 [Spongiibacteraceae bacterium]
MIIEYSKPTPNEWERFKQLHIAFGHQSVGNNLLSGVRSLAQEQNVQLSISDSASNESVVINQFPIGENGNPSSKLDAFKTTLAQGAGASANVAQMKFCYIDFPPDVDPQALANTYIQQTSELATQYPHITFIATTTPLTTIQTGPKALIKKLLGKQPAGYEENWRRHQFNQTLRAHYGNSQALFDLAAIESLQGKSVFTLNNNAVETLPEAITDDGGHLNDVGQRLVASAWIRHLAALKLTSDANNPPTTQP